MPNQLSVEEIAALPWIATAWVNEFEESWAFWIEGVGIVSRQRMKAEDWDGEPLLEGEFLVYYAPKRIVGKMVPK